MERDEWLAERFEEERPHLKAVAYRILGSLQDADDAVQESWLRLGTADTTGIENLRAWLTTVVARVCLNTLRARRTHPAESLELHMPDPIVTADDRSDPEYQAVLADAVGLALYVVLDTLAPDERLAFVLHDMFAVPFDEIARIVGKSPAAARQLASRARRRVQDAPMPDADLTSQRSVVDAFLAAARSGDFDALVSLLHPDVVLRADGGALRAGVSRTVRGASAVAGQALSFASLAPTSRPALVNGAAGMVSIVRGRVFAVMGCTVTDGKIVAMDILADPDRLKAVDVSFLDD